VQVAVAGSKAGGAVRMPPVGVIAARSVIATSAGAGSATQATRMWPSSFQLAGTVWH
jgi:hypothetical protein